MKKVLFAIQWYPSVLSANALCDEKIIDALLMQNKYEITCLCYRSNGQKQNEEIKGVHIYRFTKSWWWNTVIDSKKGLTKFPNVILFLDHILLRIKQLLTIPVFPFVSLKSCVKFAYHAYKLQKKKHFDIVVAEHHGLDCLFAGYIIKCLFPKIKFVGILWDPISAKETPTYLPKDYGQKRLIWQERLFLSKADKLIGMKSSIETVQQLGLALDEKHIVGDIPGIINPKIESCSSHPAIKAECVNIVFSGILSLPDRDPEYIIKLLGQTKFANKINLIFFCTGAGREKLKVLKQDFPGVISLNNYIPHKELLCVYQQCDILLNFGGRNPNMVPSKIFEYMSCCKPIISMLSIDNEASANYLRDYPLSICIDERKPLSETVCIIEKFLDVTIKNSITFEEVERLFPLNIPNSYVKVIDSLCSENA